MFIWSLKVYQMILVTIYPRKQFFLLLKRKKKKKRGRIDGIR